MKRQRQNSSKSAKPAAADDVPDALAAYGKLGVRSACLRYRGAGAATVAAVPAAQQQQRQQRVLKELCGCCCIAGERFMSMFDDYDEHNAKKAKHAAADRGQPKGSLSSSQQEGSLDPSGGSESG